MSQNVYQFSLKTIEAMKQFYHKSLVTTPSGAIFRAKTTNAVITGYKSGKVLFQGASPATEISKWINENEVTEEKLVKRSNQTKSNYFPADTLFQSAHIGSDEAGTGDYFGPITVACTYVNENNLTILKQIGVQDSKNLNDNVIKDLAKEIIQLKIPYSLLILRNEKYNQLQKQGWSQGKMKAMLHHHAISKLQKKIGSAPLKGILIDQFCEPSVYKNYLATEQESLPVKTFFMTKAENYSIAVAAGSIIARAAFLREMNLLSKQFGFPLQKGASKLVDQMIAKIIKQKGEAILNTCAKLHFANTKKAKMYL